MSEPSGGVAATSSSSLTDLTLAVRTDGVPEQEVFLQHGLSIGRNRSNTICVDHPDVERIHAQVIRQPDGSMLLECIEDHMQLTLPSGEHVRSLKLSPGTTFKLGTSVIRCLKRETRPTVVVADNPWKVRCPRCHEVIADMPQESGNCPKCSLVLQYVKSQPAGPEATSTDHFEGWLPQEVGPYKVRAFVAQGGMGIVLRGLHKDLDLPAAVKLLRMDSDSDPSWRQRFLAEIDTLKTLKHPHVVRLQDHGKDDRMLWLAMDWIDGQPLTKWAGKLRAANMNLPISDIGDVLSQVVQGLIYLHHKQIIHRDLKPSNILMAQDGLVKMVDFGIARTSGGSQPAVTQLTQTGMVAGTESYMSPEQSEGQPLTAASDIYSLGVIWYELVTGRRPVGAFVAPVILRPDCPMSWGQMIGACLAVDPRSRPALERVLAVLTSPAAPPVAMNGFHPAPYSPSLPASAPPPLPGGFRPGPYPPPMPGASPPPMGTDMDPLTGMQAAFGGSGPGPYVSPDPRALNPNPPGAQGALAATAGVVGGATKSVYGALRGYFQRHPPRRWLMQLGPAGRWISTHGKQSVGLGAAVLVVLVIVMVRSCASDSGSSSGGNDSNKTQAQQTPEEVYGQAIAAFNAQRYEDAVPLFRAAADRGYTPGMHAMGEMYRTGTGVQANRAEAYRWYQKGAQNGDASSQQWVRAYGVTW